MLHDKLTNPNTPEEMQEETPITELIDRLREWVLRREIGGQSPAGNAESHSGPRSTSRTEEKALL